MKHHKQTTSSSASASPAKAMAITLHNGALVGGMKNTLEELGVPTRALSLDGPDQLKTVPVKLLKAAPTIGLVMIHLGGFKDPAETMEILSEAVPGLEIIALAPLLSSRGASDKAYTELGVSVFFQKHDGYLRHAAKKARELLRITDTTSPDRGAPPPVRLPAPVLSCPTPERTAPVTLPRTSSEIEIPVFGRPPKPTSGGPLNEGNSRPTINESGEKTMTTTGYKEQFAALKAGMVGDVEKLFADIDTLRATAAEMNLPDILTIIDAGFQQRAPVQRHGSKQAGEKGSRDVLLAGKHITLKMGPAKVLEDLIEAAGKSVSKAILASDCSPATLYAHIGAIREALTEKFGSEATDCLKVHSGEGYSLDTASLSTD